jgi:putative heme-binding domain-containing protein
MGYVGGTVGPDLTRIGGIRTERDLLESIVFPNASFVRSYEPVRVVTTDERTFNGVLKKDAPDEIVVVVAADKEERIARADVASITPSSVSLMNSRRRTWPTSWRSCGRANDPVGCAVACGVAPQPHDPGAFRRACE